MNKQNKVEKDVWLGARFETTSKSFRWRANYNQQIEIGEKLIPVISKDGYSKKVYTNWQSGQPKTNADDQCVKMITSKDHQGQWIEVPCSEKNWVVCERNQLWSVSKVQQALLKLEKTETELKATIQALKDETAKKQEELKKENERKREELKKETEKKRDELQKELKETKAKLEKSIKEPALPSNFIYVQFPWQSPPSSIYSWHQWEDVTARYNGAFFRAEKPGWSAKWEQIQSSNTVYINRITRGWCTLTGKAGDCDRNARSTDKWASPEHDISLSPWKKGGISDHIWTVHTYSEKKGPFFGDFFRFYHSRGEIRPKNYAIRIWRRK